MTAQNEIKWDGKVYPYVPSDPLKVDPRISFHQRVAQDLDPISFEVIRYAMWNINVEQGNTLLRVSGSPIAAYGHDFNPCLLDEAGDFVFFGPFLQYLSSASGSAVKWTLEHRSSNPGIDDGDIFLTNDPWVGAIHQADVCIFAPLFWKGELFCWFASIRFPRTFFGKQAVFPRSRSSRRVYSERTLRRNTSAARECRTW